MKIFSLRQFITTFLSKVIRKVDRSSYLLRKRLGLLKIIKPKESTKLGVYVAYYNSSWVFDYHLRAFQALTVEKFNYYIFPNCTTIDEFQAFQKSVAKFKFPTPFYFKPHLLPFSHAESLQRMVDQTLDSIIVLCDVDAFPLRHGWDQFVLDELTNKEIVSVVVDMPKREMTPFLHPCFMAFHRDLLTKNNIDLLSSEGNDPAWKITKHLNTSGKISRKYITPLFPEKSELKLYNNSDSHFLNRSNLTHGFGTTYNNLVFHFWFSRRISSGEPICETDFKVSDDQINSVINATFKKLDILVNS